MQPGDQFVDRFDFTQVRRQEVAGEPLKLGLGTSVMSARHPDLHRPQPGDDGAFIGAAVADDLASTVVSDQVGWFAHPLGDLGLHGLDQKLAGPTMQDRGKRVASISAPEAWAAGDGNGIGSVVV